MLGASQWRVYFELDRDAAAWTTQCEALQQGGMMGVEDVVQQGTALLESTMQLVSHSCIAELDRTLAIPPPVFCLHLSVW